MVIKLFLCVLGLVNILGNAYDFFGQNLNQNDCKVSLLVCSVSYISYILKQKLTIKKLREYKLGYIIWYLFDTIENMLFQYLYRPDTPCIV